MTINLKKSNSDNKHCEYNNSKRARYFHGMLMTDLDFTEEQRYHIEKRKLLNRMLHGSGVVCGLIIECKDENCPGSEIVIKPGLALDCNGNEIYVQEQYELEVGQIIKSDIAKRQNSNVECTDVEVTDVEKWYVIVRYREVPTNQVAVYAPGGGCDEKVCDYSRTTEGYCFDLVKNPEVSIKIPDDPCNPESPPTDEDKKKLICEDLLLPCPDCCDDPFVVLGSININISTVIEQKEVIVNKEMINNWDHREYVITFRLLQHWMYKLGPDKVKLQDIINYTSLGDGCASTAGSVDKYEAICNRNTG